MSTTGTEPGTDAGTDPVLSGDTEQLSLEVLRLRDLLRGAQAQIGELTTRLARLDEHRKHSAELWEHRIDHTDRQLQAATDRCEAMESSTTWKIGRLVLTPVSLWRAAGRS
jgi:hypothetical protein